MALQLLCELVGSRFNTLNMAETIGDMVERSKYIRIKEDVENVVRHAKLDMKTLLPVTQALYFADNTNDYRLLELDEELITKLNNGVEFVFRGRKDDKAVLCSDNRTYDVKEAETSNSLLLVPNLRFPDELSSYDSSEMKIDHKEILGVFHTYLEVKPSKPRINILCSLLQESAFRGPELEYELKESGISFYSTNELLKIVQASEAELKIALSKIEAFQLEDKWRILELNYHFRVVSYFLAVVDEQSWKIDDIPVEEIIKILNDLVPLEILTHLILIYTEEVVSIRDKRIVKLNEDRVCRFLGQFLLKSSSRFGLQDFLSVWQGSVPLGLKVNLRQLDGLIYISTQMNQKNINYCPEHELCEDIAERIQFLFSLKEKWTLEEIKPFIETFTTEKLDANAILTKYARASKLDGVRVYSSRHGK